MKLEALRDNVINAVKMLLQAEKDMEGEFFVPDYTSLDEALAAHFGASKPLDALRDIIASMKKSCANPMKSWEMGEVVAVSTVEYWIEELESLARHAEAAPSKEAECEWCDGLAIMCAACIQKMQADYEAKLAASLALIEAARYVRSLHKNICSDDPFDPESKRDELIDGKCKICAAIDAYDAGGHAETAPAPDEIEEKVEERWKGRVRMLMGDINKLKAQLTAHAEAAPACTCHGRTQTAVHEPCPIHNPASGHDEPAPQGKCVGHVIESGKVEWEGEPPQEGTFLFDRTWTEAEIAEGVRRGKEAKWHEPAPGLRELIKEVRDEYALALLDPEHSSRLAFEQFIGDLDELLARAALIAPLDALQDRLRGARNLCNGRGDYELAELLRECAVTIAAHAEAAPASLDDLAHELVDVHWPNGTVKAEDAIYDAEVEATLAILRRAWPAGGHSEPAPMSENDYVAWVRYKGSSIQTCDSDAEGAFKVYRWHGEPAPGLGDA